MNLKMKKRQFDADSVGSQNLLIFVAVLMMVLTAVGRYTYSGVMSEIIATRGFGKAEAGTVTAFLFSFYAGAQILFAKFYKKLPMRTLSLAAVLIAVINFAVPFASLHLIVALWAVNGVLCALFYMMVLEMFSVYLPKNKLMTGCVLLGIVTPCARLLIYGTASVCTEIADWRWVFWISAILIFAAAVIWFFYVGIAGVDSIRSGIEEKDEKKRNPRTILFWVVFVANVLGAMTSGFAYNTVNNWLPVILREDYGIDQSVIYLLMIVAVLVAMSSGFFAGLYVNLSENYIALQGFSELGITILAVVVYLLANEKTLALFLTGSYLIMLTAYVTNALAASFMSVRCRAYMSAGAFYAIVNASTCAGICICDYGIGSALDNGTWQNVFLIIGCVIGGCAFLTAGTSFVFWKMSANDTDRQNQ